MIALAMALVKDLAYLQGPSDLHSGCVSAQAVHWKNWRRADSQMAATAGCLNFRSAEMA
jgi:hypothetical protein